MLKKLKTFWKSLTYKESDLKKGSCFYGPAIAYMNGDEIVYLQGTEQWKNSMYSFKLIVDRIESNRLFYYSFYIDPEGNELVSKHVKFIATSALLRDINTLKLWVDID